HTMKRRYMCFENGYIGHPQGRYHGLFFNADGNAFNTLLNSNIRTEVEHFHRAVRRVVPVDASLDTEPSLTYLKRTDSRSISNEPEFIEFLKKRHSNVKIALFDNSTSF